MAAASATSYQALTAGCLAQIAGIPARIVLHYGTPDFERQIMLGGHGVTGPGEFLVESVETPPAQHVRVVERQRRIGLYVDVREVPEAGAAYAGPYGRYGIDVASAAGSTAARASSSQEKSAVSTLRCVDSTPFGCPVVPAVYAESTVTL